MTDDARDESAFHSGSDAFALGAAANDPALREDVREYLKRQSELAAIQIEDARREDSVRHWGLRVRHISDVLKLGLELAMAFIVVAIAVGLGAAIWQAAHADGLVIASFDVPADMAARGLSGQVVAAKLLDRLNELQNLSLSSRPASSFANDWTSDIKVEIPDTGVSLGEVVRYLHSWLGHETHLSGDIYETADGLALTVRLGNVSAQTFTGGNLDALVQKAGEAIFARAQRYRYAIYLAEGSRHAAGAAILRELAEIGDVKDRTWANDGLAVSAMYAEDFPSTILYADRAIQVDPDFPYPYLILAEVALARGHDAKAFWWGRKYATVLKAHGAAELGADGLDGRIRESDGLLDTVIGDYGAGATDDVITAVLDSTEDMALAHDPRGARAKLDSLTPDDLIRADPLARADMIVVRGQAALDEADWRNAAALFEHAEAFADGLVAQRKGAINDGVWRLRSVQPLLAFAYAKEGDTAKADALLLPSPADCDICLRMKGRVAAQEHRYTGAAKDFATVSARSPDIPFADTDWGQMLLAKGDYDGAVAKFASAHKKGPHFADPLEMWGEALIARNRSDLAVAKFAQADKYAPAWGRLHLKWGEALFWSGDRAGAAKQFAAAAQRDLSAADKAALAKWMGQRG